MDRLKQPGINFDGVFLKDLHFTRAPNMPASDVDTSFDFRRAISADKRQMNYEVTCEMADKKGGFNLHCSIIGMFSCIKGQENLDLETFAEINAPTLIFPYLREIITSITVRAGIQPVILPPMNVLAMMQDDNIAITTD